MPEIIKNEIYKGLNYRIHKNSAPHYGIAKLGQKTKYGELMWYTAYIAIPKNHPILIDLNNIDVYGGITWDENKFPDSDKMTNYRVIGWDYCHGYELEKSITLEDVLEDVYKTIRLINSVRK